MVDGHLLESCDGREIQSSCYRNTISFLEAEAVVSEAIKSNPDIKLSDHSSEVQLRYDAMRKLAKSSFSPKELWERFAPYKVKFENK